MKVALFLPCWSITLVLLVKTSGEEDGNWEGRTVWFVHSDSLLLVGITLIHFQT